MPVSPEARLKIITGLSRIALVDARNMFGGVGLYSDGLFFGLIANDIYRVPEQVFLKVRKLKARFG